MVRSAQCVLDQDVAEAVRMTMDELELLNVYRRAKRLGFADIQLSVQDGVRTKIWLTEKMR